jgi:hypothetical protein
MSQARPLRDKTVPWANSLRRCARFPTALLSAFHVRGSGSSSLGASGSPNVSQCSTAAFVMLSFPVNVEIAQNDDPAARSVLAFGTHSASIKIEHKASSRWLHSVSAWPTARYNSFRKGSSLAMSSLALNFCGCSWVKRDAPSGAYACRHGHQERRAPSRSRSARSSAVRAFSLAPPSTPRPYAQHWRCGGGGVLY